MRTLTIEIDVAGVAELRINIPGRPVNVVTEEFFADLSFAVNQLVSDKEVRGIIITSAKPGSFLAGADLKELDQVCSKMTVPDAYRWSQLRNDVFRKMESSGKPFVAALNGTALGGGLELCLACHHRIMVDDGKSTCGLPEVSVGLLPGGGGTQRLPRLVRIERALSLMLDGTHLTAKQALELGVVHALAPPQLLCKLAREWILGTPRSQQPWDVKGFTIPGGVGSLAAHATTTFRAGTAQAARRTAGNDPAPLAILSAVYEGTQVHIDAGLKIESKYFAKLLAGPVARNLIGTMFIAKGRADRLASRPSEVPQMQVRRIGVIGAGMMGSGIAYASARANVDVMLLDATLAQAETGRQYSLALTQSLVHAGKMDSARAGEILDRIRPTTEYAGLADCDLIIEAVYEDRAAKHEVLSRAGNHMSDSALIASNTSTLPIGGLAAAVRRRHRVIGLHFFSPVERMPLVEVIVGPETSAQTLAHALDFVALLKKTPIIVKDSPGFYTTRVFTAFIDEAMCMLREGVLPALIENAARMAGMPVGPLAITDEVSLELQWSAMNQAERDGLAARFCRRDARPVIEAMTQSLNRRGKRFGGGFYEYPAGGKKALWSGLAQVFPPTAVQPAVDAVKERLLTAQALEAARCMDEGVIKDPSEADLGSILGVGFPSYTGGAISYVSMVGVDRFLARCAQFADRFGERFMAPDWLRVAR